MHVYKIKNLINGKVYIGKDASRDHHRWYYHRWAYNKPHVADYDKILYRAFRKYGVENFSYEILQESDAPDLLNEIETYFIGSYQSCDPEYGYNQRVLGGPQPTRYTYHVRSPDQQIYIVNHLPNFCREHDLNLKNMYYVQSARRKHHKGWQCVKAGDEFPNIEAKRSGSHKVKRKIHSKTCNWLLLDPNNNEILINDLKAFCLSNDLRYRCMLRVSSGERPHHKHWKVLKHSSVHTQND